MVPPEVLNLWDAVELLCGVPKRKLDDVLEPVMEEWSRPLIRRESVEHFCVRVRIRLRRRRAGLNPHPKLRSTHRFALFGLFHVQANVLRVEEGQDGHVRLVCEWTRPEHVVQPWVIGITWPLSGGTEDIEMGFGCG